MNKCVIGDMMMLNKKILFKNIEQVFSCRDKIIQELFQDGNALEFLRKIKFEQYGYDPLFEEPINFTDIR